MTFPTPSSRPARSEIQDPKALTGKTRIEARRRSSHLVTALTTCVWLLGILACGQAASQSVKCASMTVSDRRDTNFNGEYELYVRQVPAMMKSIDRVNSSQWYALTPGFTIATQSWANRVLCFEANAGAAPIYLKVVPSESYLNALKTNGLDLRIRSTIEAPSDELMLIRDGVTPVQGRLLELKNFRSVQWSDPTFPFYWSPHSRPETSGHVPWLNIQLDFVVADSTRADSDARRTIVIPRGSDIALKVMALGHEATGLELFPLANSSEMTFGVCAPPVILVNDMSTSVATIDMGVVPLDLLKQEQRVEQPFPSP
ncbi:hypothetical protein GCM10007242_03750 [Pigmentiphaga litoralis]|uniref:hypothetical protein n=1 Tax=Pigmentiphaga litoralis TaxID=516702 RepID=UPI0016792C0E|nr:hypothetical protein [Pigmentiphaga litoralis]GGX02035.1 hypothetical protein GCM10007242_03750 [Pigmentiphaga litoralis]